MTTATKEIVEMLDMLPENEQNLAYELIKRLVLAWDPDYTKLTLKEATDLNVAIKQVENGEYYDSEEIDWDNLEEMELD